MHLLALLVLCIGSETALAGWQTLGSGYQEQTRRSKFGPRARQAARGLQRRQNGPSAVPPALPGEIVTSRYLGCPTISGQPTYPVVLSGSNPQASGSGAVYLLCLFNNQQDQCAYDSNGNYLASQSNAACPLTSATYIDPSASDPYTYTACPLQDRSSPPVSLQLGDNTAVIAEILSGGTVRYVFTQCYYPGGAGFCTFYTDSGLLYSGNGACPSGPLKASSSQGYLPANFVP